MTQKMSVRTINGAEEFDVIKCQRCGDVLKYTLRTTGERTIIYTKKNMIWDLIRHEKGNGYTAGVLYFGGSKLQSQSERCDTLEPQWRDYEHGEQKIKGKSAIKAGVYELMLTYSVRFKRVLPILLNVDDFEGVRIHRGNTAKDTEGCILPGVSGGRGSGYVTNSAAAEKKIVAMLQACFNQGERVFLCITENWQ